MNEQQKETIEALRNAAEQGQWNPYREILAKLLPHLKPTDAVKIIVKHALRFLSDLSRFHPEDEDIGRAIEALNTSTSLEELGQQGQLIDSLLDKYSNWPGVNNFRRAFKGISQPQRHFNHSGEYVDTIVSILINILIASESNSYWGDNPEEFSKTFFGPDVHKAISMLVRHHSDPKQVAIRVSLMVELVNDLDKALQAG
jgi:hypothetical protein